VVPLDTAEEWQGRIDVMILCGGSASDLPLMTPRLARRFHVVDSFDNHGAIPAHFAAVDRAAREGGRLALISAGWDPGLFSLLRLWGAAFLPEGEGHTFWGPGVSQGHSDALRRVPGVADGRQYTLPIPEAVAAARRGDPARPSRETHRRVCFVAAEEGADRAAIEGSIRAMPHYFAGYGTSVTFLSPEELAREHSALPHGGRVIRCGSAAEGRQTMEFSLSLASNPRFTGGVLTACARGVARQAARGAVGCITMAELAPADLTLLSREELLERFL
jgi:diaminopimelate dehydrogenase